MNKTPDILKKILARKAEEVASARQVLPDDALRARLKDAPPHVISSLPCGRKSPPVSPPSLPKSRKPARPKA